MARGGETPRSGVVGAIRGWVLGFTDMQRRTGSFLPWPSSVFYGWWIVLAAFIIAFIYSGFFFYDFTLFVTPIREDIPDVGAAIEPAFIVATITGAVLSPILGGFFDKRGPKLVVGGGMLLGSAGFAIMGVMTEPWHLYVGLTLAGLGPIVFFAGGVSSVVNWFNRLRGRAVGITVVGLGAGGILTRPSLYVMETIGWRDSFLVMALVILVLLMPLAFVLRRTPEDHGMRPDGDDADGADAGGAVETPILYGLPFTQILRTPTFWFLSMLMFLSFWPIGSLQIHQAPFMEDAGYSRLAAADAVGAMGPDHHCWQDWGRLAGRYDGPATRDSYRDIPAGHRHRGVRIEQTRGELVFGPVFCRVFSRFLARSSCCSRPYSRPISGGEPLERRRAFFGR